MAVGSSPDAVSSAVVFSQARTAKRLGPDHSPLSSHPAILMMGAEGAGLRGSLLNHAHYKVGIRAERKEDEVGVVGGMSGSTACGLMVASWWERTGYLSEGCVE